MPNLQGTVRRLSKRARKRSAKSIASSEIDVERDFFASARIRSRANSGKRNRFRFDDVAHRARGEPVPVEARVRHAEIRRRTERNRRRIGRRRFSRV